MKAPANFISLQRRRLYEDVAEALKQAILKGDYKVGDKLPSENELAGLFQVSRAVIREAIRYLELTGLVTIKQGATGGAFVSEMKSSVIHEYMRDLLVFGNLSVSQLLEIRQHVDPEVSRLAALRATEKDLSDLEKTILFEKSGMPGIEYMENNANFHRILGRASQNLLYAIIEDCIMDFVLDFLNAIKSPDDVIHDPQEHEAIYKAVASRKPDLAMKLTKKHVGNFSKDMMKLEKEYLKTLKGAKPLSL